MRTEFAELTHKISRRRDLSIEALHRIVDAKGCLPVAYIAALADLYKNPHPEAFGVASFFHHVDIVRDDEAPPVTAPCSLAGGEWLWRDTAARVPARSLRNKSTSHQKHIGGGNGQPGSV